MNRNQQSSGSVDEGPLNQGDRARELAALRCDCASAPSVRRLADVAIEAIPFALGDDAPGDLLDELCRSAIIVAQDPLAVPAETAMYLLHELAVELIRFADPGDRARLLTARAFEIAVASGHEWDICYSRNVQAVVALSHGDASLGMEYCLESLAIAERLGDVGRVGSATINLTSALETIGLYREAISVATRAVEALGDDVDVRDTVALLESNIASCFICLGDDLAAFPYIDRACALLQEPDAGFAAENQLIAYLTLLECQVALHHPGAAATSQVIARLADRFPSPRIGSLAQVAWALKLFGDGDRARARVTLSDAVAASEGQPVVNQLALELLVRLCRRDGDTTTMIVALAQLIERLETIELTSIAGYLQAIGTEPLTRLPAKGLVEPHIRALNGGLDDLVVASTEAVGPALERLAVASELREDARGRHAYRVGRLAAVTAHELGWSEADVARLDRAARLHDIGKLAIPDELLLKAGRFSAAEFTLMQQHTVLGRRILEQVGSLDLHEAAEIAESHHERFDGRGYPHGRRGEDIPLGARIVAVADVYDAMTHSRVYKRAWRHDEAVAYIRGAAGGHFDPQVARAFCRCVDHLHSVNGPLLDEVLAETGAHSMFLTARDRLDELTV